VGRLGVAGLAASIVIACAASSAAAAPQRWWAGYMVTGTERSFSSVSARWVQPTATCRTNVPSRARFWVGIGGRTALERIGSGVDCDVEGHLRYYLWWGVRAATTHTIALAVAPRDVLAASVALSGKNITLRIRNVTRGTRFRKTVRMRSVDRSSAEWVTEAPSLCRPTGPCLVPVLTDFGHVAFARAAVTSSGRTGRIADKMWRWTRVAFPQPKQPSRLAATAIASDLGPDGRSFSVAWYATAPPEP
jgi:hypothetical protein